MINPEIRRLHSECKNLHKNVNMQIFAVRPNQSLSKQQ